ncbi:hypothetical protein [Hugenholtzia roseola]|uniref:hypothetical protein n=1 Tax=Hugenholtzia roseola TaxID=1002 RepID=UPI0004279621|nr:hypothetical protein [Hugenholtzia roseola]
MKYLPTFVLFFAFLALGITTSCQPDTGDDNPAPVYGFMEGYIGDTAYWQARDVSARWVRIDSTRTLLEVVGISRALGEETRVVLRIPNPAISSFSVGILDSTWSNAEAYYTSGNAGGVIGDNGTVAVAQLDTALQFFVEGTFEFAFESSVSDTIRIGDDSTGRDSVVTTTQQFDIKRGTFNSRMTRQK